MPPLRPDLYRRLDVRRRFGGVVLANEGEVMKSTVVVSDGRRSRNIIEWGEAYRTNCPFCYDTRHRLYINYAWGLLDPETGTHNWWLCRCYNESCVDGFEKQMELRDMVYDDAIPPAASERDRLVLPSAPTGPAPVITLPGYCVDVSSLPDYHPCRIYLRSRNFEYLMDRMRLQYCVFDASHHRGATDRLVIPVHVNGKLVLWQARWLDLANPNNGEPPKRVPKYLNPPDGHKAHVLYNYDTAIRYGGTVPLFEGPTDVWRFGPEGCATLGKGVSLNQAQLVRHGWPACLIVVDGNDPDAETKAVKAVTEFRKTGMPSAYVKTPQGTDPGKMETSDLRQLADSAAASAGLPPIGGLKPC